jgi:hypothetical protein
MGTANYYRDYDAKPEAYLKRDSLPLKNAFCPYYGECLEVAIEADWPQFTCINCRYQDVHLYIAPDRLEMEGHYRLLEKLFGKRRKPRLSEKGYPVTAGHRVVATAFPAAQAGSVRSFRGG